MRHFTFILAEPGFLECSHTSGMPQAVAVLPELQALTTSHMEEARAASGWCQGGVQSPPQLLLGQRVAAELKNSGGLHSVWVWPKGNL